MDMHADAQPSPLMVVAIDNQDVVLAGLRCLLITHPHVVRAVSTYTQIADVDVSASPPDVVLLDFWLGRDDQDSLDAVIALKQWGTKVLMYTSEERPHLLRQALRAGVDGLCLKNDGLEALVTALHRVGSQEVLLAGPLARAAAEDRDLTTQLTDSEIRVLAGLAYGLSPAEIADKLTISQHTVRSHERHIHDKYREVAGQEKISRAEVLFRALRDGYWNERTKDWDPDSP